MSLNIEDILEEMQVPEYRTTHISREDILTDLVKRVRQIEDLEYVARLLRSNLYAEARRCGVTKRDLREAQAKAALKNVGGTLADHLSGENLRKDR